MVGRSKSNGTLLSQQYLLSGTLRFHIDALKTVTHSISFFV
jgi:hypothetical protein